MGYTENNELSNCYYKYCYTRKMRVDYWSIYKVNQWDAKMLKHNINQSILNECGGMINTDKAII